MASFGQLVPGYYPGIITFYGLFFAENYSLDSLLESSENLYENMLKYKLELENTICTVSKLIREKKEQTDNKEQTENTIKTAKKNTRK